MKKDSVKQDQLMPNLEIQIPSLDDQTRDRLVQQLEELKMTKQTLLESLENIQQQIDHIKGILHPGRKPISSPPSAGLRGAINQEEFERLFVAAYSGFAQGDEITARSISDRMEKGMNSKPNNPRSLSNKVSRVFKRGLEKEGHIKQVENTAGRTNRFKKVKELTEVEIQKGILRA